LNDSTVNPPRLARFLAVSGNYAGGMETLKFTLDWGVGPRTQAEMAA
jgi:hypothetical protein